MKTVLPSLVTITCFPYRQHQRKVRDNICISYSHRIKQLAHFVKLTHFTSTVTVSSVPNRDHSKKYCRHAVDRKEKECLERVRQHMALKFPRFHGNFFRTLFSNIGAATLQSQNMIVVIKFVTYQRAFLTCIMYRMRGPIFINVNFDGFAFF